MKNSKYGTLNSSIFRILFYRYFFICQVRRREKTRAIISCEAAGLVIISYLFFERRVRRLLAESAEASDHVSSTPDSRAMTRCPLAILKIKKSGGNRGVDNEVGVVATFPARLRILRVVCGFCVPFPTFMKQSFI